MIEARTKRIMNQLWIIILLIGIAHADKVQESFRLPQTIIPEHYRIKILTDLTDNFFYNGEVCIDFLVKTATNKIVLHSKNLKIFDNETKVEEYGKLMNSKDEVFRKPKQVIWDGVGFHNRPTAKSDEIEFTEEPRDGLRVLANEKKKPDVVFDRHELFEKQESEFMEETEEGNVEKNKFKTQDNHKPQPLPSDGMIIHEKIKNSYNKDKHQSKPTLTPVKNQNDKATTTESGYSETYRPTTTMPTKYDKNRVTEASTEYTEHAKPTKSEYTKRPMESTLQTTEDSMHEHKYTTMSPTHSDKQTTVDHTHSHKYTTEYANAHKYTTVEPTQSHKQTTHTNPQKYTTEHTNAQKYTTVEPTQPHKQTTNSHKYTTEHAYAHKYTTNEPTQAQKQTSDDKIHFITSTEEEKPHYMTSPKPDGMQGPSEIQHPVTHETIIPPVIGFEEPMRDPVVPKDKYAVLKHEYDMENSFLIVHLDKPLSAGKKYKLYLTYQGVLTDTLTGFHRVPYLKRGASKSTWLASTVFEPNEARTAFPCFDEPGLKATFDVTLGHNKKFTALSNMPLKSKAPFEGKPDYQWSEFETTPKMSTYTLAFLISDLEYLTPRVNFTNSGPNVTYRFWSRPDVLYKTRYAMRIAPEMKNYLENLLQVRDVLPKHDFVALPSFISSALENWGLYSFAEKNLLFTPGFSSIFTKYEITHVVAHEIAHMWFGNMVTPKWWDQIWLSEGFSNFFEILAADHVQPSWDLKSISVIFSYLKVFTYDALHTSHPLVPKLRHSNDLNEIFDSITYQKGFYLVRMLNYTLGQETFLNGVRRYLKTNLLSNTDENDLWDILTECAHEEHTLPSEYNLRDVMYSWTRRTGYPIIDVYRDYENHTANVTQRRFLRSKDDYEFRDNSQDIEGGETKWYIPLTYTTGSELNFRDFRPRLWLTPQEDYKVLTDMPSRSDFVLMNLDAAGLYRVNYDERNWALIISYLLNENSSDISVINRVQILDDLLDLARTGEISYEKALDATSYLAKERHFLPWKAALSNFDFISRMLRSTDSNKSFKKFVKQLVTPRFEELGFESTRNEPLSDGLNRKQMVKWACRTGVRQCTRKSIALFKKWTEEKKPDEHNPIPSNLRSIVYCTAIENGGSKDWQFLWQRYLSNVVTDKTAILYGLGCSKSTRTLRKYLDWSIKESSGIKKQDTPIVFKAVVRNDAGFNLAKTFLKERIGDIKTYLGNNPFYLPQMIDTVAAKMNHPADLEELEELEQAHYSHLRSVPRSFRQATERVKFNINWIERNYKPINDWLKRQRL